MIASKVCLIHTGLEPGDWPTEITSTVSTAITYLTHQSLDIKRVPLASPSSPQGPILESAERTPA